MEGGIRVGRRGGRENKCEGGEETGRKGGDGRREMNTKGKGMGDRRVRTLKKETDEAEEEKRIDIKEQK